MTNSDDIDTIDKVLKGDIEVLLAEELKDGTTHLMICDHRRTNEEGEIYEIII